MYLYNICINMYRVTLVEKWIKWNFVKLLLKINELKTIIRDWFRGKKIVSIYTHIDAKK